MKHFLLSLIMCTAALAQTVSVPIANGKLTTALNGNGQDIMTLDQLGFGANTPTAATARIHILPNGTPTTAADGIKLGTDVQIYRSATGTLNVTGNLVVSGTIAASAGVVQLAATNTFIGTNNFNGAVNLAGTTTFSAGFTVSDNTVRDAIRDALDLVPGTDVQAYSTQLLAIAGLNPQDSYIIVGNGTTWVTESGATARTSLGVGTGDNVTFTNGTLTGTLAVTGNSTLGGKVTASGAVNDATGLTLGTAGAWYGSGSGIVTDDPVTLNADVVLGDNSGDNVTVTGTLKLGSAGDASLSRTGSNTVTLDGSLVADTLTLLAPMGPASGGTGLDLSAGSSGLILMTSGSGLTTFASTALGRALINDATEALMRARLLLGTAAVLNVPGSGNAASGEIVLGSDTRLTNSRPPTGSAAGVSGDIEGNYPDTVTIKANAVALGTDTTGNYIASMIAGTGVSFSGSAADEAAAPTISIGQAVATSSSPTFVGLTLTGDAAIAGKTTGVVSTNVIQVAKDGLNASDTRTSINVYDQFRPFVSLSAAFAASSAGDQVFVQPADTEYSVPAEFGADTRHVYLAAGANVNGLTVAAAKSFSITGPGSLTGDISVGHASATVTVRTTVTGDVSVTDGWLGLYGDVTGNLTVTGGTVVLYGTLTGSVTVNGGTVVLRGRVVRTTAGAAVTLTTGTLNCDEGAQVTASASTETGITRAAGTWNVFAPLGVRGLISGTYNLVGGTLTYYDGSNYVTKTSLTAPTVYGTLTTQAITTVGNVGITGTLDVSGAVTFSSTLSATTSVSSADGFFSNDLDVDGDADVGGTLIATAIDLNGNIDVSGTVTLHDTLTSSSSLLSTSATLGIGYDTGAGDVVTQITSASTSVSINTVTGQITTVSLTTAGAAEEIFTVDNTAVADGDTVQVSCVYAGAGTPVAFTQVVSGGGSFKIVITNLSASALNAVVRINFTVLKGASS